MSKFGWWYPPGAANDPNAPYNQVDPPCEVCGKDDCICPECPTCGCYGDPTCYDGALKCSWCGTHPLEYQAICERLSTCERCKLYNPKYEILPWHHLVRTEEQVASMNAAKAAWAEEARQEALYAEQLEREQAIFDEAVKKGEV